MGITVIKSCLNCGSDCSEGKNICDGCSSRNLKQKSPSKKKDGFAPFIAVKIETSGLPDKGEADILEIAMVYGDYGSSNPDTRPTLNFFIKNPEIRWQPEAKERVGYIEKEIADNRLPVYTLEEARVEIDKFLKKCLGMSGEWKNLLVGTNMYSLTIPMLKKHGLYNDELIDHAALDINSLFYFNMGGRSTIYDIMKKYDLACPDNSALTISITVMSAMYEAVGYATKKSTVSWY